MKTRLSWQRFVGASGLELAGKCKSNEVEGQMFVDTSQGVRRDVEEDVSTLTPARVEEIDALEEIDAQVDPIRNKKRSDDDPGASSSYSGRNSYMTPPQVADISTTVEAVQMQTG